MKKLFLFGTPAILFSALLAVYVLGGCKKDNNPLGLVAPNGFDVPTSTPTPTTGSFNIYVVDGTTPINGVTVFLVDPSGNTLSSITQPVVGYASFSVKNIANGIWTAGVSQQSYFGYSTIPITVTNNTAGDYYFTAASQSVSVWNITTAQSYPYNTGTALSYGVSYVQPGNLNEPVSMSYGPAGILPTGWGVTFYPAILGTGNGVNSGTVTVTIPPSPCTIDVPVFNFISTKINAISFISDPQTITKNFTSNFKLIQTFVRPSSGFMGPVSLLVSSTDDCGVTWDISWTYYINGSKYVSGSGAAKNGLGIYVDDVNDSVSGVSLAATVTGNGYTFSGSGAPTWNTGNDTTIINANF